MLYGEGDGSTYYSPYIARHSDGEPQTVSFTLMVESDQTVMFIKRWGIYASDCDVLDGELVIP